MKKYIILQILLTFFIIVFAQAQNKLVKGIVSSNDSALVGATVIEKGVPSNGTATNANGQYQIVLRGTSNTIFVSAIGFTSKEVRVGKEQVVNVSLAADLTKSVMNEVVVVGYGRQKKITLTGAVSSVSGQELRENPSASLQNTLTGKLPGFFAVQPSGRPGSDGATFYIRGQSTYNSGGNSPLIIVDDVEYSYDQFARLDPNEIESLSILKDASTTAVYGVKGANGVVVVTTRRGKSGPPKISLRIETSLNQPAKWPQFLDAYETALLYNQAEINDNNTKAVPDPAFKPKFSDADLELFRNGQDPYGHPNIDWKEVLFKKFSRQYKANFDISGGAERIKYFISIGYLFQDGILKNYSKGGDLRSNYYHSRYNYRSNLDIKATNSTDIRLDLYGNIGEINNPNTNGPFGRDDIFYEYSSFLSLAPWAYPIYNPDGSYGYSNWQRNNSIGGSNYNVNNVVGRLTLYGYNRDFENNMNLISTVNQKLDALTKGLSLKGTVAYTSNHWYNRGMERDQFPSFIYNPATNTYEPRDPNIYRIRRYFLGYNAGSTVRKVTLQGVLNYDRLFGVHRVYGLALFNQSSNTQYNSNSTYNFIPENFRGFSGRLGYNYREKYLFELNAGYNGSDRFSKDNRYGFFPAASAGWNISSEPFFKDKIKFVDRLKLRGSYGLVGNDKVGGFSYYYVQTYSSSGSASFGTQHNNNTGYAEGTLSNMNVTWEKEKKLDLGIDFGMFQNKLAGSVEYFNNNRYDILTSRGTVSAIFGQSLPPVNLGKVNNKGYEIEVNYNGRAGKEFSYRLRGTYSVARNKIIYRDEPSQAYEYQAYTGKSIGQIRVYEWTGTFYKDSADIAKSPKTKQQAFPGDLKYKDLNNDGVIDEFDMSVTGYSNTPNITYGFQFGFTFKGFSVNAFFQGAKEFNVRAVAEAIRPFSSNLMAIHQKAWTPELGDNAQFPRLSFNSTVSDALGYPSTFWFIRGDYLRLKTAEIGYALPKSIVSRLGVESLRVYTNGYNLLTWTKLTDRYELDPEINSGTDRINYPPQRIFNFGLNVTF